MQDPANQWMLEQIKKNTAERGLWFVDENYTADDFLNFSTSDLIHSTHLQIISNRSDLVDHLRKLHFNTTFSDFDTETIPKHSLDRIFYRVSKEKNLTHHLINLAGQLLKPNGLLYLVGYKQEGIKTYIEKANALFGSVQKATKQGPFYTAIIPLVQFSELQLPTDNYPAIRKIFDLENLAIYSKPGQFGWNKIDQGSELLIDQLEKYIAQHGLHFHHCLDLGCGYGFLSLAATRLPIDEFTLTDNNAAALASAKINLSQCPRAVHVLASDAGAEIEGRFDLILCNPPFHHGFSVDTDLTEKFLRNTSKLLRTNGKAFYVVNQFIPLEAKAEDKGFSKFETLIQESGFKVILLEKNTI